MKYVVMRIEDDQDHGAQVSCKGVFDTEEEMYSWAGQAFPTAAAYTEENGRLGVLAVDKWELREDSPYDNAKRLVGLVTSTAMWRTNSWGYNWYRVNPGWVAYEFTVFTVE